tara:strand:+ start:575 stop:823 length:249 start_codon:yes stop_codon:yes gene_type:complete
MSGLFPSSKAPPPPTPELDERESKLERQELDEKRKIASRSKARRAGGYNMFMTKRAGGSAKGNVPLNGEQNTLGYGRNTRIT